jgi:hypothetical protein
MTATTNTTAAPASKADDTSPGKIRLLWVMVRACKRERDAAAARAAELSLEMPDLTEVEAALDAHDDHGVPLHWKRAIAWIEILQQVRPDQQPARPAARTDAPTPPGAFKFCPNCGVHL